MTATFDELLVPVTGGALTVRRRRSRGPTLLFLHYWGGSGRTWERVLEHLDPRTSVATYDHRGWGRSHRLPGPYDLNRLCADAAAIVEALDTDVVLVGHSMGGKVAQLVAAERPAALHRLILVAPAPPEPPPTVTAEFQQQLAHAYDSPATVEHAVDHILTATPLEPSLRAQVIEDSLAGADEARLEWPLHGIAENVVAAARRIRIPTNVIAASRDVVEPVDVLRRHLLPFVPGAQLHVLDGPGHLIPLEAPEALTEQLARFLT